MLWRAWRAPSFRGCSLLPPCPITWADPVRASAACPLSTTRAFSIRPHTLSPSVARSTRHAQLEDEDEDGRHNGRASPSAELVKITGLVRSVRRQKRVAFARVDDGSTLTNVQAVFADPGLTKDVTNGAYVALIGRWTASPGSGQTHELQVERVESVGESNPLDNPIQKQSMSVDFLRTVPHLRLRTSLPSLVARARSHLTAAVSSHFHDADVPVYQVHPPLITSSDCEGAGEVFTLTPHAKEGPPGSNGASPAPSTEEKLYFREPKYLTVSAQLHLEAYAAELGDVFSFAPAFRAEPSDTSRHLSEFYMLEAEHRDVSFAGLLAKVRALVVHLTESLQSHRTGRELLEYYGGAQHRPADVADPELAQRWNRLIGPWDTVEYSHAVEALTKAHDASHGALFSKAPRWDQGLQLEHERWIVDHMAGGRPVLVTHYPRAIKPFYMLPSSLAPPPPPFQRPESPPAEDPATVACFDLLLPFGYCEVIGGSLREHRLEHLIANMRDKGLLRKGDAAASPDYPFLRAGESLGGLKWYADLRRYGSSPHGGYGLGFDRLLAYLTGVGSVRDVVGFPRTWGRADC